MLLLWGVGARGGVASGSRGVPSRRGVCPWGILVRLLLLLLGWVALRGVTTGGRGWVCARLLLLSIAWVRLLVLLLLVLLLLVGLCIGGILREASRLLTMRQHNNGIQQHHQVGPC
jgi:hypothetical protein